MKLTQCKMIFCGVNFNELRCNRTKLNIIRMTTQKAKTWMGNGAHLRNLTLERLYDRKLVMGPMMGMVMEMEMVQYQVHHEKHLIRFQ